MAEMVENIKYIIFLKWNVGREFFFDATREINFNRKIQKIFFRESRQNHFKAILSREA